MIFIGFTDGGEQLMRLGGTTWCEIDDAEIAEYDRQHTHTANSCDRWREPHPENDYFTMEGQGILTIKANRLNYCIVRSESTGRRFRLSADERFDLLPFAFEKEPPIRDLYISHKFKLERMVIA